MGGSDAYYMGIEAFYNGDAFSLCPYDPNDAQSDEWEDGFLSAEEDHELQNLDMED